MIQVHNIHAPDRVHFINPARIVETGSFKRAVATQDQIEALLDAVANGQEAPKPQTNTVNYVVLDGCEMLEIVETPNQLNMMIYAWDKRALLADGPAVAVCFSVEDGAPEFTVISSC